MRSGTKPKSLAAALAAHRAAASPWAPLYSDPSLGFGRRGRFLSSSHGFRGIGAAAQELWQKASCLSFLPAIRPHQRQWRQRARLEPWEEPGAEMKRSCFTPEIRDARMTNTDFFSRFHGTFRSGPSACAAVFPFRPSFLSDPRSIFPTPTALSAGVGGGASD